MTLCDPSERRFGRSFLQTFCANVNGGHQNRRSETLGPVSSIYAFVLRRRRRSAAKPKRPVPNLRMVEGSGESEIP
jgi:hypothetical protein